MTANSIVEMDHLVSKLRDIKLCLDKKKCTQKNSKTQHLAVKNILLESGIEEIIKETGKFKKMKKGIHRLNDGLYFMEEPFGSQQYPDFVIMKFVSGRMVHFVKLELKSGHGGITWNDGYPRDDCVYLYYEKKEQRSYMFTGEFFNDHVVDHRYLKKVLTWVDEINNVIKKHYSKRTKNKKIWASDLNIRIRKIIKQNICISKMSTETKREMDDDVNVAFEELSIKEHNTDDKKVSPDDEKEASDDKKVPPDDEKEASDDKKVSPDDEKVSPVSSEPHIISTDTPKTSVSSDTYKTSVSTDTQPKAISLFSGAGGDTLGMKRAGIDVVGFVECDEDAIHTHLTNFPESKLIGEDIREIKDEVLEKYAGSIDVLFGGFPCQSFSHGGKKRSNDPRGQLYKEFVRFAKIIKPRFIIGENVEGILKRKNNNGGLIINDILADFSTVGYDFVYKRVKCENFGVPQQRRRIIFVAERKLPVGTEVTERTGTGEDKTATMPVGTEVTERTGTGEDKTATMPVGTEVTERTGTGEDKATEINIPEQDDSAPVVTLRNICEFDLENALKIEKKKFIDMIPDGKFIESKCESKCSGKPPTNLIKCYNETANHGISFGKRAKSTWSCVEDLDKPTHTILCTYGRMPRLFVPLRNATGCYFRAFNIKELQQIQGFPADFKFTGDYLSVVRQIGNAVPPQVITAVVNSLFS